MTVTDTLSGALILLLYILLLYEVITNMMSGESTSRKISASGGVYRPKPKTVKQETRGTGSLDALWRRMCHARQSLEMNRMKHSDITARMAEARIRSREAELQRISAIRAAANIDNG